MRKSYIAILIIALISAGVGTSIILNSSPSSDNNGTQQDDISDVIDNNDTTNDTLNNNEENGHNGENGENETITEPIFLPEFHVFNVEYHRQTVEGQRISSPSYVTFLIQNMGNGSATEVSVWFNFSTSLALKTGEFLLQKLEAAEVRDGLLELSPSHCSSAEIVKDLSVVIQCKENVTESLNPSFIVS